ncbi:beta-ketoacyl-ACP synthase II [bacterium]|nr:beta-ketoacyl-ACP synthase II [bacterium]
MSARTVVITGIGVVSALGVGKETFWKNVIAGQNGVHKIEQFDPSGCTSHIAAEVKDFNPEDFMDRKEVRRRDKNIQFAVGAAKLALQDSGLELANEDTSRIGVIIGSGIGGIHTFEVNHSTCVEKGPSRVSPFFIPMIISNMASGVVGIELGLKGVNYCVVSACATGTHALAAAADAIRAGRADVVFSGGTEAAVCEISVAGFCSLHALSTRNDEPEKASRPFDKERDGFVLGEGAAVLTLESLEHAQARNAHIYAILAGSGATCDAHHITAPDPEGKGAENAMRLAIADAGLKPEDIDYINAHGTSTPLGDPAEIKAIKNLFGEHAYKLAVSSTKSMLGHALGATGAIETAICALALQDGIIPPTINYEYPDPECDLDIVPNVARKQDIKTALNNSFGFGGQNAVVVLKKYEC